MDNFCQTAFNGVCVIVAAALFTTMLPIILPFWVIGYLAKHFSMGDFVNEGFGP